MNRILTICILACVVAASGVFLMGCATTQEPKIVTREVKVPVVAPCVGPNVPPPPQYPDSDDALRQAPNAAARYSLMGAGREKRNQRLGLLEKVVEVCRMPARQIDAGSAVPR